MARLQRTEYYDQIKSGICDWSIDLGIDTSELSGDLAKYAIDPYAGCSKPRANDEVEVLFIGGGFSALITSMAKRTDWRVFVLWSVDQTYWNRYPGAACDICELITCWMSWTTCR